MLQTAKKYLGISLGILAIVMIAAYLSITLDTNAQTETRNETLQKLFESLRVRAENEPEFIFNVQFAIPIMDNDETWWHIPYTSEDGEIFRTLGEVGNDYICFFELAGSAPINRCTPFSNIVSITFLGDF